MTPVVRRITRMLTAHIDGPLLGTMLLLMGVGLIVIFSGSNQNLPRVSTQMVSMLVALGVMYAFANIPPHYLTRIALPLYVLGVLLLVCVALFGDVVNGARRWLHVGVTRIQPSEIMKIAVPLMLAWYFDRYEATLKLKNYIVAAAMLVIPVALIVRQPDLGTAMLIMRRAVTCCFLPACPGASSPGSQPRGLPSFPLSGRCCTTTSASAS